MYLMGNLLKPLNCAINGDNFKFNLLAFGGPSGGNLFGRFTHGCDEIENATKIILEKEQNEYPDSIFAEVVHLPQARLGNVLLRPVLRTFEIPYVGKSGADNDCQIPIDDLWVSVQQNKVLIRSKRLNKYIIPRMTTAHNYLHKSLPAYKFLCDLQGQGYASPKMWDWGSLNLLSHLPSVIYKNIIIMRERWRVELKEFGDLPNNEEGYLAYFAMFRKKRKIPARVLYLENDQNIFLDLDEVKGIDLFLKYLSKNKTIIIEEFLFNDKNCVVTDSALHPHANELIIPIHNTIKPPPVSYKSHPDIKIKKTFYLNDEWLYFKIYGGPKSIDNILNKQIASFIEANGFNAFEQFFFVRYKDDFSHLRIRFYNSDISKQNALQINFVALLRPYLDEHLIYKIVLDTYTREVERYGESLIIVTEKLFHNDSLAVLRINSLLNEISEPKKFRLLLALRGVDILLDDFKLTIHKKKDLLQYINRNLSQTKNSPGQKNLNEKYRRYQKLVFSYMDAAQDNLNETTDAVTIYYHRSVQNKPHVDFILAELKNADNEVFFELLSNYIHMNLNRLFITQQKKYELIVYHFLERYYLSQIAIRMT